MHHRHLYRVRRVFSLVPLTFITKLRRPLRERIVISFLMAMGIMATGAAICKVVLAKAFAGAVRQDFLYYVADYVLLAWVEVYLSIIAVCVPTLKSLFQKGL